MISRRRSSLTLGLLILFLLAGLTADRVSAADEGMWTFDNPPLKQLKEKYGFTPTPDGSTMCACRASASTTAAPAPSSAPAAWC